MPDFTFSLATEAQLTIDQNRAWQDHAPVLVTGGPGTGKTVVSIYRFLSSIIQSQNTLFFTFNRTLMVSIKGLLRQRGQDLLGQIAEDEREGLISASVNSMYEWYHSNTGGIFVNDNDATIAMRIHNFIVNDKAGVKYEDIHIDEAQDMMPRIIRAMNELTGKVNCSADRAQDLQGNFEVAADVMIEEILNSFRNTHLKPLDRNFRNTKQIFQFARRFVWDDPRVNELSIDGMLDGEVPEVFGALNEEKQLNKIWDIVDGNQSNIGIIVFSQSDIITIRTFFRDIKNFHDFSYYYANMPSEDKIDMELNLKTPFIITYESCKGLEFDTVIMPFFQKASWMLTQPKTHQDGTVQQNADGSTKMICTKNHYYVACTRAKKQLYIFYDWGTSILNDFNQNPRVPYKLNGRLVNV